MLPKFLLIIKKGNFEMRGHNFCLKNPSLSFIIFGLLVLIILSLLLLDSINPVQAGEEKAFIDLDVSDENYRYVKFLQNRDIIKGFPDGTFRPFGPLTRAEAAKMTVTAINPPLDLPEEPSYADVPFEHWAYPYIETATKLGFLTGYPDGTFQPERQLTRGETAVLLYRIYGTDYRWSENSLAVDLPNGLLKRSIASLTPG